MRPNTRLFMLLCTGLAAPACLGDYACSQTRSLAAEMSMDGVSRVEIEAYAGDLTVRGGDGERLVAGGRACTAPRYAERLDDFRIDQARTGTTLRVIAVLPRKLSGASMGALDLSITLPGNVPVSVLDTSGDVELRDLAAVVVRDSSGDLSISDIAGDVAIERDSSGDISVARAGNVRIDQDSSGDIVVREALSFELGGDSSGDIRGVDITGSMRVDKDTSGDITAVRIGGDFAVGRDSSGDITIRDVAGQVSTPKTRKAAL